MFATPSPKPSRGRTALRTPTPHLARGGAWIIKRRYAPQGWAGIFIALAGTGIGQIPVLCGSRRINCAGILLLPIACNMSGFGHAIAALYSCNDSLLLGLAVGYPFRAV